MDLEEMIFESMVCIKISDQKSIIRIFPLLWYLFNYIQAWNKYSDKFLFIFVYVLMMIWKYFKF